MTPVFIGSDGIEMKDVLPGTGTAGLTLDNVKIVPDRDHGIRGMGGNVSFRLLNSEIFNGRRRHRGRRDVLAAPVPTC